MSSVPFDNIINPRKPKPPFFLIVSIFFENEGKKLFQNYHFPLFFCMLYITNGKRSGNFFFFLWMNCSLDPAPFSFDATPFVNYPKALLEFSEFFFETKFRYRPMTRIVENTVDVLFFPFHFFLLTIEFKTVVGITYTIRRRFFPLFSLFFSNFTR